MWKRNEVNEAKQYRVALCQQHDGHRSFALCPIEEQESIANAIFFTEVVPTELLLWRNFGGIAKAVLLTNGKRFHVEAHGVWFTEEEHQALQRNDDWRQIPWLNGLPPVLPPM